MMTDPPEPSPPPAPERLASLDAWRGFVMLLMMAEILEPGRLAGLFPESAVVKVIDFHTSHVAWIGCSLHDMIQPSFTFLVGTVMVFSLAKRREQGQSEGRMTFHAFWRALLLILLGVWLRSIGAEQTNWTFEDTLTQIGLGYGFLFLIARLRPAAAWWSLGAVLFGYWLLFALYPLPLAGDVYSFDYSAVGASAEQVMSGFAAHWNINSNAAWAFDRWFMNLFPRGSRFEYNGGGYSTLSFIPTLGTMLLGLLAGRVLQSPRTVKQKLVWLSAAGVIGILSGLILNATGICPMVKRIWTPSWTLFSGGVGFLMLAGFWLFVDVWKTRRWAFPLVVIGANSIAAYLIAHLWPGFLQRDLTTHFGLHSDVRSYAGRFGQWEFLIVGIIILLIEWLVLYWLHRRRIFLRI